MDLTFLCCHYIFDSYGTWSTLSIDTAVYVYFHSYFFFFFLHLQSWAVIILAAFKSILSQSRCSLEPKSSKSPAESLRAFTNLLNILFYISLWLTLKKILSQNYNMLFYISSWLTLKKILSQNYKNYTARLDTLGWAINHPCTKYSLKGLYDHPQNKYFYEKLESAQYQATLAIAGTKVLLEKRPIKN